MKSGIGTLILLLTLSAGNVSLANPVLKDRETIKKQAGCYEVTFEFRETDQFVDQPAYISPPYKAEALEWITLEEDTETKIMLQHLLMTPAGIIKHWRQDWTYQPRQIMEYAGENLWKTRDLSIDESTGRWSQFVTQVDDSPRYGCAASWNYQGPAPSWTCQTWAPLPRREFSQRSDYNILDRGNHVEVDDEQWVHREFNTKILSAAEYIQPIAREVGANTYKKTEDKKCQAARDWWNPRRSLWAHARGVWEEVFAQYPELKLRAKVNGMTLWEALFLKTEEIHTSQTQPSAEEIKNQIRATIQAYIE